MKKISLIFGTRPEGIKLCPLILAMKEHPDFEPHVCVTGQHRQMLDQVLDVFEVVPDVDLNLMQPDQTLAELTAGAITAINSYLANYKPDIVIVQGDTTTTFCAAIAAFYNKIPIGHLEAGLRTSNKFSPFPEKVNRILTSHIADVHFAPTERAQKNLMKEGVEEKRIFVTGNTIIRSVETLTGAHVMATDLRFIARELLRAEHKVKIFRFQTAPDEPLHCEHEV